MSFLVGVGTNLKSLSYPHIFNKEVSISTTLYEQLFMYMKFEFVFSWEK